MIILIAKLSRNLSKSWGHQPVLALCIHVKLCEQQDAWFTTAARNKGQSAASGLGCLSTVQCTYGSCWQFNFIFYLRFWSYPSGSWQSIMMIERKDRNSPLGIEVTKTIKILNKSTLIGPHTWEFCAGSYILAWKLKFHIHSKRTDLFFSWDCYWGNGTVLSK